MATSVLLVDDNRVARLMLRLVVSELRPDWKISEAQDGKEAMELARNSHFDVLLVDVGLPGISGLDLAADLKEIFPAAALAMVTANIQKPVRQRAEQLGAAFIEKPLKPALLLAFFDTVEGDHGRT